MRRWYKNLYRICCKNVWKLCAICVLTLIFLIVLTHIYKKTLEAKLNTIDFMENFEVVSPNDYIMCRNDLGPFSELGKHMFLFSDLPSVQTNRRFKILIWQVGERLESRHIRYYTNKRHDPFEDCSANNCDISYDDEDLQLADAVVFHLHTFGKKDHRLPDFTSARPPHQRWVFLTDESQHYTFVYQKNNWSQYAGVFNWSMSYKAASDVPVPCGRTKPKNQSNSTLNTEDLSVLVPFWKEKQRDVFLVNVMSFCGSSSRMKYIRKLEKHMKMNLYGRCGYNHLKDICPFEGYGTICKEIKKHFFYLAFLNSNCDEYIDEKIWMNSFAMGAIPIILGCKKRICEKLLPPESFIHVDDFESPQDLANYINDLTVDLEENILNFHRWRNSFTVEQESGYVGSRSKHYCRLCEALNYNDPNPKIYGLEELRHFLDPKTNCYPIKWKPEG